MRIQAAGRMLNVELSMPDTPTAAVVIAEGVRRPRLSQRHRALAASLTRAGFVTLLADLLTLTEAGSPQHTARLCADNTLMAGRICALVDELRARPGSSGLPVGVLSANSCASAALLAAAARPDAVRALVLWDARPNLSTSSLTRVAAATLLASGEDDRLATELSERAARYLPGPCEVRRVSAAAGAGLPFDRLGTDAAAWFRRHLRD
jgi:putative phosphoribosyl transferase